MGQLGCEVCGREFAGKPFLDPPGSPETMVFCDSWECQRIAQKRSQMSEHGFSHFVQQQARMKRENQKFQSDFDLSVDDLVAAEDREDRELRIKVLGQHPEIRPEDCDVVPIPSSESRLAPKDPQRVEKFRDYVVGLVEKARRVESVDQVPAEWVRKNSFVQTEQFLQQNPSLRVLSSHICSICRGGCCSSGGDKAHLSVDSIRQRMDEHPDLSDDEIVEQYLDLIPENSIVDACIMQSSQGCSLPRSMRGMVCNGYSCESLKRWQAESVEKGSRCVVVVQRNNDWWSRFNGNKPNKVVSVALVQASGVKTMDPLPATSGEFNADRSTDS